VLVHQSADSDVMEVTAPRVLGPGESYTMETVLANPSAGQLSSAGVNYPQSVKDYYLQLPPDYAEDVKSLSENVTAGAATPYARAIAVIKYLSALPYQAIITAPPQGTDGVQYFLFTQKSGFCLYFASAMAVMLRSVDIPTRLVVGYLPGDPGNERGTYLVRDWHYHAWTQVYFPGYGWVNFEATPSGGGGSGSQVSVQAPLVSSPAIKELPQWNAWNYPLPTLAGDQFSPPPKNVTPAVTRSPWNNRLPFADELGQALVIIAIAGFFIAVIAGIIMITRRVFNRRLWHVDREALALTTYNKLIGIAAMAKIEPSPQQTPLEFAAELKTALPEEADDIDSIVGAYLENRFGNREGKLELYREAQVLKARHVLYDKLLRLMGKRTWGLKVFTPG
jgi:transglutaminase-like putative cysteine protease